MRYMVPTRPLGRLSPAMTACLWAFAWPLLAQTTDRCTTPVAQIVSAQGSIELRAATATVWNVSTLNAPLCPGDSIRAGQRSRAALLLLHTGAVVRIDQLTTLQILEAPEEGRSLIDLLRGIVHFFSRLPRSLEVRTPFVSAGVEGTEFVVAVQSDRTLVSVFEGLVRLTNPQGSLTLAGNQSGIALDGQAPQLRVVARPRDAVQWAIYYQPILTPLVDPSAPATAQNLALRESMESFSQGDLTGAFDRLDGLSEPDRDESFYVYRAGLLLAVGGVEEARSNLDQALVLASESGDAYALRAVISIAHNDPDQALVNGRRAVQRSPRSSAARIALSYAQQANFELEAARDTLLQVVQDQPNDNLAWARLAELWLSLGDLDRALEAAETSASVGPALGRTQTVLGFARLAQIKLSEAKAAFERAIVLESESSLARLGLGLAKIRDGDLREGRSDIEIAATLDPNNSLIRSYLGKAYFDERRDTLAEEQLTLAKQLDPNDPTPFFYDAIRKQTTNRPVEALRDLQRSMELNDNRAVYRSRLLLDEDLGARGASLGRIYQDLGFEQLALVEGTQSLAVDPANHSAHRFLSDSYATRPRHEIARASELLRAQLLQPVNINPIQPLLGETDLNIVSSVGPAQSTFNEFTPLFERDRPQLTLSGLGGNHQTWGDEVVFSGVEGRLSYSAGQFHYQSDGFRENNDLQHDIYNLFTQAQLTPRLNLQAEYRRRETEQGDLLLNFDPEDFSTTDRRQLTRDTVRFGVGLRPSPASHVLGSLIYSKTESARDFVDSGVVVDQDLETQGYDGQAQYIFSSELFTITAGLGAYDIDREGQIRLDFAALFGVPCPFPSCETPQDSAIRQYNAYVYTNWNWLWGMTWTFGLGYDSYEEGPFKPDQFGPKAGLLWQLARRLRLRLAYTKGLARTLLVDQTLEPTQVAGFNQFFDDFSGTRTERYGLGIDAEFSDDLYGGLEFSRRNLKLPLFLVEVGGPTIDVATLENEREDLYLGYLYWTPHSDYAFSASYQFEKFRILDIKRLPLTSRVQTTTVPLSIRYFNRVGLFAELKATYVLQEVEALNLQQGGPTPNVAREEDREDFLLVDGAVGYRLPKRRGVLALEVNNLLDRSFRFEEVNIQRQEPDYPRFLPDRSLRFRLTINF